MVVREGTEGPYTGTGGAIRVGTPHEVATEVSLNTAFGVRRVVQYAFERARQRRKHLTLVHKTNVLTFAGKLWSRIVAEVGEEYPDVEVAYQHVDAATIFLVTDPGRFDVIVTDNLFGDIITDLAAAVCGGIGLAASGNIDATRTNPSMFEPVHGSAPDIAGQGIADPTAAIMSVALLLAHLGEDDAAARVDRAVATYLATRGNERLATAKSANGLRPRSSLQAGRQQFGRHQRHRQQREQAAQRPRRRIFGRGDQRTEQRGSGRRHQPLGGVLHAQRASAPERPGEFGDRGCLQPVVEHRDHRDTAIISGTSYREPRWSASASRNRVTTRRRRR